MKPKKMMLVMTRLSGKQMQTKLDAVTVAVEEN
jgi:hypothetical protein